MALPLTPDILIKAYSVGLFPMAQSRGDDSLYWVDPEQRGILPLNAFHVSRKLKKQVRRGRYRVSMDEAFPAVMHGCAEPAPGRRDTWINDQIMALYQALAKMGCAHSIEVWDGERLVGGLYGVAIGAAFFGESMFSRVPNASKIALVHLVARLIKGDFTLLDTQFVNDHLTQFGVVEILRDDYRQKLSLALRRVATLPQRIEPDELDGLFRVMGSGLNTPRTV